MFPFLAKYSVIVPVYNAFNEALHCAESLLKFTPKSVPIYFIDDCSTDGDFLFFLQNHLPNSRIQIVRNQKNLGFVASCNLGFKISKNHDVILLNSDTIVTKNWSTKLKIAAHSNSKIGTVTPLTNNGSICSFPNIYKPNEIPKGFSLDQFAELIHRVSEKIYPKIPTCVGFCVYIKRNLLNKIGFFDEESFTKGYGEENDFSCRAQKAGFIDILDDSTFIYHKGSASFGAESNQLSKRNTKILNEKHPEYPLLVESFLKAPTFGKVHSNIFNRLVYNWSKNSKLQVLHIIHNGPYSASNRALGGTELLLQDLIETSPEISHWSMCPNKDGFQITAHMPELDREFLRFFTNTNYEDLINQKFFDIVHVHHTSGYKIESLFKAIKKCGNYFVSIHDHHLICPRIYLLKPDFKHCDLFECQTACGYEKEFLDSYRSSAISLLSEAKKVFHFSDASRNYIETVAKRSFRWHKTFHGVKNHIAALKREGNADRERPSAVHPMKVCFIGSIYKHKGSQIIQELVENKVLNDGSLIDWHLIGETDVTLPAHVTCYGKYTRDELPFILKEVAPHLVCILSLAPETYSLTLDEVLNSGIPVIVPPLGAPAERIKNSNAGWILKDLSCESIMITLLNISENWADYFKKCQNSRISPLKSIQEETKEYLKDYYALNISQVVPSLKVKDFLKFQEPWFVEQKRRGPRTILREIKDYLGFSNRIY